MNITATMVLRGITIFGTITSTWPSNRNSHFLKRLIKELQWLLATLNIIALLIPLSLGAYHYSNEPIKVAQALSVSSGITLVFAYLILCKWQENQLRTILAEIVPFVMTIKDEEEMILHKWVHRYLSIWIFSVIWYSIGINAFALGPLYTSDLLPMASWYPFEIKPLTLTHCILYIQHITVLYQVAFSITIDITISFLFCCLSAKLDILGVQIRVMKESKQLYRCIKEHENCIQFFNQVTNFTCFIVMNSNLLMTMAIVFAAIPLLFRTSFSESSKCVATVLGCYFRIYMNTWPTDDVREMSLKIASSIYESSWIDASMEMRNSIAFIICRAQTPLIMSIPGLLPPTTLQFFASFVSTTLSYFATVRAIIGK